MNICIDHPAHRQCTHYQRVHHSKWLPDTMIVSVTVQFVNFFFMSRSEQLYIEHWKILWLMDLEKTWLFSRVIFGTHKKAF